MLKKNIAPLIIPAQSKQLNFKKLKLFIKYLKRIIEIRAVLKLLLKYLKKFDTEYSIYMLLHSYP